jgi:uncharacterized protein (TIGR03437 family)
MRIAVLSLVCSAAFASGSASVTYTITTVAGGTYNGDGLPATAAYLSSPEGLAADAAGNIYVSDSVDHRVRKIDASGVITTIAGNGYPGFSGDNGPASAAQLNAPYGLAADSAGNLYIADLGNARVRKITPDGVIRTIAGGSVAVELNQPRNLAVDAAGNVYISDFGAHRVYELTPGGTAQCIAGLGYPDSIPDGSAVEAIAAPLNAPAGLALDSAGALYIADSGNGRVRQIQNGVMSTVPTPGMSLGLPAGLALDAHGNLYVADKTQAMVVQLTPSPSVVAGNGTSGYSGDGGPATSANLIAPRDIVFDTAGNLYIADSGPGGEYPIGMLRCVSTNGTIETAAGGTDFRPLGDGGPPLSAHLGSPFGVALAPDGTLYISDQVANRVRQITGGIISTLAGTDQLQQPSGIALDGVGNLWIAEAGGNRVWQITPAGGLNLVAGLSGDDSAGYVGDGGAATAARLNAPEGVAADGAGNLYIADTLNHAIREVLCGGTIITIAGNGVPGYSGDGGPAYAALLDNPAGLAVDAAGNVYIADTGNHTIRKIDTLGMIATVAGTGAPGFGGDGGPATAAQLNAPAGVALDSAGNLYIADSGNQRIREVAQDGAIATLAGSGLAGYAGDGGPALLAELNQPAGLAIDAGGNIFLADQANQCIRQLAPSNDSTPAPAAQSFNLVSAASLLPGPVAPGELIEILGTELGPEQGVAGFATELAGTQVLFGAKGTPAQLFYVQSGQITLQVPYEIAGSGTAEVQILEGGVSTARLLTAVADSAPAIFTLNGGTGQAAAINGDGTANTAASGASPGDVLAIFATGEGQTSPAGITGKLAAPPYPVPVQAVSVSIGGRPAAILYAGGAPGFAGLMQVNVRIPDSLGSGPQPVELTVGSAQSQAGVVITLR